MQMEIDYPSPSPSFRHKCKRPRSPDDMGSPHRPTKHRKPTDDRRSAFPPLPSGNSFSNSHRSTSEDWVQQASGLTIDTPVDVDGVTTSSRYEFGIENSNASKPHLHPLIIRPSFESNTNEFTNHTAPMDDIEQHAPEPMEQTAPARPPHISLRSFPQIPPSISVQPPTPDTTVYHPGFTRSPSPLSDAHMSVSNSPFISSPLRRKFTMGPRADCEKCRLGVKGHSVHLD
ncbi:hypothetical protein PM082_012977 [Marasmius tenuissimus]|nr:hypothetical protein PM082_012977 [Marasmius tenuissimus]